MRLGTTLILGYLVLASLCPAPTCHAGFVVVPNALRGADGNSGVVVSPRAHIQQVYASSQFSALGGPVSITQMSFRPDARLGSAFTATNPGLDVELSTTARSPGDLSTFFAQNIGADNTIVYRDAITFSSAFTGPTDGRPKNFDITINFTTPFYYNPATGNLLVDFGSQGPLFGQESIPIDAVQGSGTFGVVSSIAGNIDSISGIPSTAGFVTRFTFTSVPEPASLVSLGLGLGLVGVAGLTLRTRARQESGGRAV
jgi:hypothetical protein